MRCEEVWDGQGKILQSDTAHGTDWNVSANVSYYRPSSNRLTWVNAQLCPCPSSLANICRFLTAPPKAALQYTHVGWGVPSLKGTGSWIPSFSIYSSSIWMPTVPDTGRGSGSLAISKCTATPAPEGFLLQWARNKSSLTPKYTMIPHSSLSICRKRLSNLIS